jgi:hypothetical protein
MNTKTNILVTLGEIMKTVGMIKSPFKALRSLTGKGPKTFKDIYKAAASGHLEMKYGWKQLFRDVIAFANVYDEVAKHMEYLENTVGRARHISFSQKDVVTSGQSTARVWEDPSFLQIHVINDESIQTARFGLNHLLNEVVLSRSKIDHVLDALGAKKLAFAAWDLVPFSFVVDWVVHFDRFMGHQHLNWNSHTIAKMGYSLKTEHKFHVEVRANSGEVWDGSNLDFEWKGGSESCYKTYNRTRGFPPDTGSAGIFSALTITNLGDAAALIAQRI